MPAPAPAARPAAGLLLAAGAGRRYGTPKALVRDPDGTPWVLRAARTLADAGCDPVTVVVGASAEQVTALLAGAAAVTHVVVAADWHEGMGASLRAGLAHLARHTEADRAPVALVHLVDLPDVTAAVVGRLREAATGPEVLARATYDGRAGHPVLLGRDHWAAVAAGAVGDRGARDHLATHAPLLVECGDLATGRDHDVPRPAPGPTPDQRPAP